MKRMLLALGVLAGFVSLFADAQSPPRSLPGNPQAYPDKVFKNIRILGGGGGGPLNPFVCPKNQDCDLTVIVAADTTDPTKCKLDIYNVVLGPKQSKNVTWNLFPSDGTYLFDPDPAKAVDIDNNTDSTGKKVYDVSSASKLKHKKNVKSPEATVFGYTVRVQSSDGTRKCELDPVIVSRD